MPLQIINGPFIQPGESVSDAVDVSGGAWVRLTMPGNWSAADLTFQISSDGIYFNDMFDADGREIAIPVFPGVGIIFPRDMMAGVGFVRFRSGNRQSEVPQPELREFSVAIYTDPTPSLPRAEAKPAPTAAKGRRKTPRKAGKRR